MFGPSLQSRTRPYTIYLLLFVSENEKAHINTQMAVRDSHGQDIYQHGRLQGCMGSLQSYVIILVLFCDLKSHQSRSIVLRTHH